MSPDRDLAETRRFFAGRAAGWEERFPDDGPVFEAAVAALRLPAGGVALDAGCGTGRALPMMRRAVGPSGRVLGVDVTPEMLAEAARLGRRRAASLLVGDARRLPIASASVDGVLAAGLVNHLADPGDGLVELARVVRPGGRVVLFHPVGRAALAARHGRQLDPADVRAEPAIRAVLAATGWEAETFYDGDDRYLAVGSRR